MPSDTAARFNRISGVYDETRQPLTSAALDRAAAILSKDGVSVILEAGVGTGRIALPLQQRNFKIYGVDIARGMITKARDKGIQDLIIADANRLPLKDGLFDAAIMAHVIHLLEDPSATFQSLRRVATKEIVVFVRKREDRLPEDDGRAAFRENFRRAADELGYGLPARSYGSWDWNRKEGDFLSSNPPSELVTVEDELTVTTVRERLSFLEKRAFGHLDQIPDEIFHKIMERVTESVDLDREIRFRRVEQMAIWRLHG